MNGVAKERKLEVILREEELISIDFQEKIESLEKKGIKVIFYRIPISFHLKVPLPIIIFEGNHDESREFGKLPGLALINDILMGKVQ